MFFRKRRKSSNNKTSQDIESQNLELIDTKSSNASGFYKLPNELISHIFLFLNADELNNVALVCKLFSKIINDNFLNYNYSNKILFSKWQIQELKKFTAAVQSFDKQLTVSLFNRPDISGMNRFLYYMIFILMINTLYDFYKLYSKYSTISETNLYFKKTINDYRVELDKIKNADYYPLPNRNLTITWLKNKISEHNQYIKNNSANLSAQMAEMFGMNLFFNFCTLAYVGYIFYRNKRDFSNRPINQKTFDIFDKFINDNNLFFPGNFIVKNNIRVGVTTNQELISLLKTQIVNIDTLSKKFITDLKQIDLIGRKLKEKDFLEIEKKDLELGRYARHASTLWYHKMKESNKEKVIFIPSEPLAVKKFK